ncbi:WD40-repeat-containing domain protein [Xylariomycetidae sp. FL2044]|nr:WD40-repeat-containing domain protein [Xylariomycetidae sp. FL2044]
MADASRRSSSISLIQSRLRRLKISSAQNTLNESPDEIRGPLGLTTLHDPSEPCVDFIFVHGLGGGSRKTWSHSQDKTTFWPKEWLPSEPGFKHVRIHSYGYGSDWTKKQQSSLTIHDFGQALLADIYNSPRLRATGDTPIVFIAHSMGGLVVKKAYLLSTRDKMYQSIGARIHSIFFLATPHRGADSAKFVTRFLSASILHGSKSYVKELLPGSGTLQTINDEFRHVCENVNIWSFFESTATVAGPTTISIVDKESAVIGLPGEHVQYLNADHRHICKFESPDHANYVILHRCLSRTVQEIEKHYLYQKHDEFRSQMKRVSGLLGIQHRPDMDLLAVTEKQHKDSCTWLTRNHLFQDWLEVNDDYEAINLKVRHDRNSRFLWLNGPPGSGKSVAAGHVVKYLKTCNFDCSFYFFSHQDREKSSLSHLFRSLAFQMAESSPEVRRGLLHLADNEGSIGRDDYSAIWNMVFRSHILRAEFSQTQFWVIDALDECSNKNLSSLAQLLSQIPSGFPLQILFTSRPGVQIERFLDREGVAISELRTGSEGTLVDIASFMRDNWPYPEQPDTNEQLLADILKKSNGIFLWASLTIARLTDVYGVEDIRDVLHQVPSEMDDFYTGIVTNIANSQSADLATCILKWILCAARPLTIDEAREAVRSDINRTLTASDDNLGHLCGHLITIDKMRCLRVIHQTVTVFLTRKNSYLWIDHLLAHSRLAEICLQYLNSKDVAPPRFRRVSSHKRTTTPFADYACNHFSYHLAHSSTAVDTPLILLNRFIESNSLAWVELVASTGSLTTLTNTIENLRSYLERMQRYRSSLDKDIQQVKRWLNDIAHIVAAFGPNLLDSPSSIHFLIPPLCPPASLIHTLFAKSSRHFDLIGSGEQEWDDRISCFIFPTYVLSIACGMNSFAIGLRNGEIRIYSNTTLETISVLDHGEPVRLLSFGNTSSVLASCSPRKVLLWSTRHVCLWSATLEALPLGLTFRTDDSELLIPKKDGNIGIFKTVDGTRLSDISPNHVVDSDSDENDFVAPGTPPAIMQVCESRNLVAIAYRNSAITLWDLDRSDKIGIFEKEGLENIYNAPQVYDISFNPVSEIDLMAVAYADGDIITCDPWALEQRSIYNLPANVLATSPDGRTLAAGDTDGVIYLFEFETLRLLYRIDASGDQVLSIMFASNGLRFFDRRQSSCNVWEPPVLIRQQQADDESNEIEREEVTPPAQTSTMRLFNGDDTISVIEHHPGMGYITCGRENGLITIHELKSGRVIKQLRIHGETVSIRHIRWNAGHTAFVSVDYGSRCIITQLSPQSKNKWQEMKRLLICRLKDAIWQVIIAPDASAVLLGTTSGAEVWSIDPNHLVRRVEGIGSTWLNHPTDSGQFVGITGNQLRLYDWKSFSNLVVETGMSITSPLSENTVGLASNSTWLTRSGYNLIVRVGSLNGRNTEFMTLNSSQFDPTAGNTAAMVISRKLRAAVKVAIGLYKSSLFFLDNKGWVCSIQAKTMESVDHYTRHFFIPLTWQTGLEEPILRVISKSSVAFAHQDRLVVFNGFLDFEEKIFFEENLDKQ